MFLSEATYKLPMTPSPEVYFESELAKKDAAIVRLQYLLWFRVTYPEQPLTLEEKSHIDAYYEYSLRAPAFGLAVIPPV
jgi:hypothetical protein